MTLLTSNITTYTISYYHVEKHSTHIIKNSEEKKTLFPPGLEPGTFRVLGERDNHYTTETLLTMWK